MKLIHDPSFRYTASYNTDVKKTFERIRRRQRKEREKAAPTTGAVLVNVASIVKSSAGNRT
jgi:hypothetical protein